VLGLPDGITTRLFDLDRVLTQTAEVRANGWKEAAREHGADVVVKDLAELLEDL
jgi:phosphoglycolate phosphatase-like HAD superfamily hydrolase